MRKWAFLAGVAVGYVLGAKAGRERYDQLVGFTHRITENPTVRNAAGTARDQAGRIADTCQSKMKNTKIGDRILSKVGSGGAGTTEPTPNGMQSVPGDDGPRPEYWEHAGVGTGPRPDPDLRDSSPGF